MTPRLVRPTASASKVPSKRVVNEDRALRVKVYRATVANPTLSATERSILAARRARSAARPQ